MSQCIRTLPGWACVAVTLARPLHVGKSRPKQEGKDQASDTYNWLPCTWKWKLSLADSSGAELTSMTIRPSEAQGSIPHWRRANTTGSHMLHLASSGISVPLCSSVAPSEQTVFRMRL